MTTFLVVDDETDLLELVRFVLHDADVRVAASARDATAALRERDVDVLLLDVTMPEVDGPSLLAELRREGIAPDVVYFVSAIPQSALVELAEQHGALALAKPFTAGQLRRVLDEHLSPA